MLWCDHCNDDIGVQRDPGTGYTCCLSCGRIIDQDVYHDGPTFEKGGGGQSKVSGNFLHSVQGVFSVSRERTLNKGKDEITDIVNCLQVGGGESIINKAHAFYQIAVDKNFTRGRRTSHVAAVCLYIACRQNEKAYLLIDFTDYLQTNVYVLGAVFLQFCKVLSIEDHPIIQKLVDPSLFIHRFTERLLGRSDKKKEVSETALRIVASMKRDWMQTGRKPSGLCGAALYISALSHGLSYSKSDIVTVVHICEATLTKRLIEFENTESGFLTIEEFDAKANEFDTESHSNQLPKSGEVLCEHKDTQEPHFAHGLCRNCYNDFIEISGGLQGGADPPAFQHAERQRTKKTKAEENRKGSSLDTQPCDLEHDFIHDKKDAELSPNVSSDAIGCESPASKGPESSGHQADDTSACNESQYPDIDDEQESLSDIDDAEVDGYLHNEEEKRYKTIIWEEMNKEYLEEQAAKEAAAAAAKEAHDANLANGFDAETATALTKSRKFERANGSPFFSKKQERASICSFPKERKQRRAEGDRNSAPAQTPAEATSQMLKRKGLSSKINYKALESLYNSDQETEKKQKTEIDAGDADGQLDSIEEKENLLDTEGAEDCDEAYTFEDGDYEGDDYDGYYGNGGEGYGNNEEYDYEY